MKPADRSTLAAALLGIVALAAGAALKHQRAPASFLGGPWTDSTFEALKDSPGEVSSEDPPKDLNGKDVVTKMVNDLRQKTERVASPVEVQPVEQAVGAPQPAAVQEEGVASVLNPADALDEAKVGVAAKFAALKPGEFEMGSPKDEAGRYDDEIQHTVRLTKGFEMQATAVTQLQYFLVTGRNPSTFRKQENCDQGNFKVVYRVGLCVNHPVENVSWDDVQAFITQLNQIQSKYTYRLPTEAEWEYAARAGMPSRFPYSFDTNELNNYAWYDGNSNGRTHAVATKKPNQYGLYDMNGNVWQWVNDWYAEYPTTAVQDPAGGRSGNGRVIRGGSWSYDARRLRSAFRFVAPGSRGSYLGFRLVRSSR